MAVRLGISPIGWSNDDLPELGGDTPLEICLAEARLAGFEGIELGNKFPRDPAVLRPIMERHELSLISGWYSGHLLERSPPIPRAPTAPKGGRGMGGDRSASRAACRDGMRGPGLCGGERKHCQ